MPVGLVAPLPPWAEAGGGAVRWKVETAGYFRITCRRCLCFFHVFSKYIKGLRPLPPTPGHWRVILPWYILVDAKYVQNHTGQKLR